MSDNGVKLSIDEQIADFENKNVKFDIYSKEDAKKFLRYNSYFFKLKSYAHNYEKYRKVDMQNMYVNLDFAYLVELSSLDMYLRRIIMGMCLDLEHVLKTRLIYDITNNPKEDGYDIIKRYVDGHYDILVSMYSNIDNSANSELIKKIKEDEDNIPAWKFVEVLSFGRFIELYELYYGTHGGKSYSNLLGSIKFLRNAAAHNTCLLNTMRRPYSIKVKKSMEIMNALAESKKFTTSYKTKMQNPVVHDLVVLLFVYFDILNTSANRSMRDKGIEDLDRLFFEIMPRHKEYFEKNNVLVENYNFICQVITFLKNKRNKQILKNCS